jgi:hypothetical protein
MEPPMSRGRYEDLTGRRYGRLRVERDSGARQDTHVVWVCHCRPQFGGCGSWTLVNTSNLNQGNTLSCGCLQKEIARMINSRRRAWRHHLREDDVGESPLA